MINTSITVQTRFEGLHHWPQAPDEVAFLRNLHRHEFHVHLKIEVNHSDRELEFVLVKRTVENWLVHFQTDLEKTPSMSCEDISRELMRFAMKKWGERRAYSVSVLEDGENGATMEYKP